MTILHENGIYFLLEIRTYLNLISWVQSWISFGELNLHGDMAIEWHNYTFLLAHNVIYLHDREHELQYTWNWDTSVLTSKQGYEALSFTNSPVERSWW